MDGTSLGRPDALETAWPAYLDGERTLAEAAADLLRAAAEAPREGGLSRRA